MLLFEIKSFIDTRFYPPYYQGSFVDHLLMSGSRHIRRGEIVVELGILFSFNFSAEQKSDLKECKSL